MRPAFGAMYVNLLVNRSKSNHKDVEWDCDASTSTWFIRVPSTLKSVVNIQFDGTQSARYANSIQCDVQGILSYCSKRDMLVEWTFGLAHFRQAFTALALRQLGFTYVVCQSARRLTIFRYNSYPR